MSQNNTNMTSETTSRKIKKYLLVCLGFILFLAWLVNTPPGLLGKTDAVGYAVCHRISSHSFFLADRPFSLCARCTGQYLGFLWGFGFQVILAKKRVGFPKPFNLMLLGGFFLAYFIDGVNSVTHLYPGLDRWFLYEPINELRLFTGLGMGLVISALLYPLAGQTVWKKYSLAPAIKGLREWIIFTGGAVVLGLLILTGNPLVLYPIILLSTAGLLFLLMVLYGVIWLLIMKKENSVDNWRGLSWWGLAGLISALVQIMAVDAIRYLLTGTWSGFLDY
jgi:uncharacterized membrane protein